MISNLRIATVISLLALTFFAMQFFDEVNSTPILKPLNTFPNTIGKWTLAHKRTLDKPVVEMLGVDDYIDYTYVNPQGERMDLYVSYFSAVGISGSYHSPQNCLPGGGWQISSVDKAPIVYGDQGKKNINKLLITHGNKRQLVYYWFQNRGRIIASEYWDKIYTVLDSITMRRRDGSFIRVISNSGDEESVQNFSLKVALTLNEFLPGR
jgi:EpsI family protein